MRHYKRFQIVLIEPFLTFFNIFSQAYFNGLKTLLTDQYYTQITIILVLAQLLTDF